MILRVLVRRLMSSIPVLLIVLIGLFVLLQFAPGDTVDALLAQLGGGGDFGSGTGGGMAGTTSHWS